MASFGLGARLPGGGSGFGRPQRHGQQRQQRHRARSSSGAAAGSAPQQQVRATSSFQGDAAAQVLGIAPICRSARQTGERCCTAHSAAAAAAVAPAACTQGLLDNPWVKSGIISGSLSLAGDVLAQLLTLRGQQQQVGAQGAGAGGRGYAASHSACKLECLTLMLGGCCLAGLKQQRLRCDTSSAHGHLWAAVLRPLPGGCLPLTAVDQRPAVLTKPPSQQLAHRRVLPLSPCRPATGNSALIATAAGRPPTCCRTGGTACWRAPSPAPPSPCLQPRQATDGPAAACTAHAMMHQLSAQG